MPMHFLSRLSQRERRMLMFGMPLMLLILAMMLFSGAEDEGSPSDAAPALQASAPQPSPPAPAPIAASTQAPSAPQNSQAWPSDIVLKGISARPGGGAIFVSIADDRQRRIRIGRQIVPGWTLTEVARRSATVTGTSGETRELSLQKPNESTPVRRTAPDTTETAEIEGRESVLTAMNVNMEEDEENGMRGYRLKSVPAILQPFGLRAGDLVVKFQDEPFDGPGRLQDLAGDIAAGKRGTLVYLRDGKQQTLTIP